MNKRILSLFLAAVLLLSAFCAAPITARAASEMTASDNCLGVIKELEGFSATPYRDTDGKYTIGYGTRCPDELVEQYRANPMTREQADAELRKEMATYEAAVNAFIDRHGLTYTQGQFDAVISLVFNCGTSWLTKGNTLIGALAGDVSENDLIHAFSVYSMSGGRRSVGHVKRRLAEANMYLNQQYSRTPPSHYSYVLYNGNGGTVSEYDVQGYDAEITAEPKATATYEGYTFQGWYTAVTGGTKVTKLDQSTKAMTLYAHWSKGETTEPTKPEATEPTTEPTEPAKPSVPGGTAISPLKITVTGSSVRIRKGPGLSYDVVKSVSKNTQLTINATYKEGAYTWGKCSNGWIRLDNTNYDTVNKAPAQKPEEDKTTTKTYGTVTGTDTLNVRKTPDGTIVGKLKKGDKVEILERKTVAGREWGRYSGGWICLRTYVKLETVTVNSGSNTNTNTNTNTTTKPSTNTQTVTKTYATVIKTSSLNIRQTPDGKIVGKLKQGEKVEILERKTVAGREWGRCSKGWICLRTYVKLETVKTGSTNTGTTTTPNTNTNTNTTTKPSTNTQTVTKTYATVVGTDSLNLRITPDGAVCGSLKKGTKVEILERKTVNGREWGRCSKGWICLRTYAKVETVTVTQQTPATNTGATASKLIGTVTASALNIRKGAGTGYTVVGKLYKGEKVEILEKKTVSGVVWGRCSQGWVSLDYVKF